MAEEGFKRKLTAILSADVIGYSRLMRDDEEATVRDIAAHRVLISNIVQQHHGRVVDSPGDNILAEFASVVDAVNGAIKIQEKIKKSNTDTPKNRRMEFRIGINLGDVIEEEERIYGDGVNIAARVEGLALAGGIAISGTVYEHIKEKLSLGYQYLGEQDVKNISEPVRVYLLLTEAEDAGKMIGEEKPKSKKSRYLAFGTLGLIILFVGIFVIWNNYIRIKIEPASVEKMAFPLPEKPSIAVLPFDNLSDDPKQEFFSDGLTTQIISSLSKLPRLFVISRNSTFVYKGKPVKVQQVAEDLGVKFVLEGSAQKSGERVRITAQLINAISGRQIWSESYDRTLKEIFKLQDEIALEIVGAMRVELTEGEQSLLWMKGGTDNLKAFLKAMEALAYVRHMNIESNTRAHQLSEEVISMDPEYAGAYTILASAHMMDVWLGYSKSNANSLKTAAQLLHKSIDLDATQDYPHALLGYLYSMMRQYDKAIEEGERAIELNPNSADAYAWQASNLRHTGRLDDAVISINKALRLSPFPPSFYQLYLGHIYRDSGMYEKAISAYEKVATRQPNNIFAHIGLTSSYSLIGKDKEAQAAASQVIKINPKFSVYKLAKATAINDLSIKKRFIESLRKAGLPEHPPPKQPDKPSIAVLPFKNMSGDPEQEYFSDGITEDIITDLSKILSLFVIARNSVFIYKGKAVKIAEVGRELGVRYVLEGSVRKANGRVRITAQLVDANTEGHIWAERYDRNLKDIFALQDEVTQKIVSVLAVKLTEDEQYRLVRRYTDNMEAYDYYLRGLEYFSKLTKETNILARQMLQRAIDLDPQFAAAYALLGLAHSQEWTQGWSQDSQPLEHAFELAQKAIALDETLPLGYTILAEVYLHKKKHEKAIAAQQKAIALSPNDADGIAGLGGILTWAGRPEETVGMVKKAMRLNPMYPTEYLWNLGHAYYLMGRYEEAVETLNRARDRSPEYIPVIAYLAASYAELGRMEEARTQAAQFNRLSPRTSIDAWRHRLPYKDKKVLDRFIRSCRKAGMK